jgi:LPS export ABC transporter permease LptG/LPS export ABC transporter permease LptF
VFAGHQVLIERLVHVPQQRDAGHNEIALTIVDRYVIRQVLMPFVLGVLVLTFLLIIPGLMKYAEEFIAKGAELQFVGEAMLTLLPGALALTIPMALLLGLLVAFGRLSADREFVALQACGVSLTRLLRPVALFAVLAAGATAYMWMVGMPAGNDHFRQIAFQMLARLAEGEVKPQIFYDRFPGLTIFVRDVPQTGGWDGVFIADSRSPRGTTIYQAEHGRVLIDRPKQIVELVLDHVALHSHSGDEGSNYDVSSGGRAVITLDPKTIFSSGSVGKGEREMSIPELEARAAELRKQGLSDHNPVFEMSVKYAIPAGCFIFGLIGLALGATNRRDGTLAGFVVGVVVVFIYYALLELGRAMAKGHIVAAWLAPWLPNLILGILGLVLIALRRRVADQPLRLPLPAALRRFARRRAQRAGGWRLPVKILDRYVTVTYLRILVLTVLGLSSVFYISTFVDQAEKVFKGAASWTTFGLYLWYLTPQYVYYIIPLSILIATLTTVATLTRSSELIIMKACGISLYRTVVPMLVSAIVAAGAVFAIEQTVLGPANRKAERFKMVMKGQSPDLLDINRRTWVLGNDGDIYHYNFFDPAARRFTRLSIFEFAAGMSRISRRTFADSAVSLAGRSELDPAWQLDNGWTREFNAATTGTFTPFVREEKTLEPFTHFMTQAQMPEFMSYTELRDYTDRIDAGGAEVVTQRAALARKLSFPFVTLVMTLIAVPFAVTIGRSGAMAGIGVAIAVAIAYWVTSSVFGALGAGGAMPPQLAAWAPNLLFGAGAIYLLLTVRT